MGRVAVVPGGGDIAGDEIGPLGMAQGSAQDTPQVSHGAWRQAGRRLRVEERLHVGGGERAKHEVPKSRSQVEPDDIPVRDVGPGPDRDPGDLRQPALEECADR